MSSHTTPLYSTNPSSLPPPRPPPFPPDSPYEIKGAIELEVDVYQAEQVQGMYTCFKGCAGGGGGEAGLAVRRLHSAPHAPAHNTTSFSFDLTTPKCSHRWEDDENPSVGETGLVDDIEALVPGKCQPEMKI